MSRTVHRVSWPQRNLLRAHDLYPGDPANNIVLLFRVEGHLDTERFSAAIETCLDQMVAAKVSFATVDGDYTQVFDSERRVRCAVEFVPADDRSGVSGRALAVAHELASTPIDPANWPLVQVRLFCAGPDAGFLLIALPHVICDAYSSYTMFQAIADLYNVADEEKTDAWERSQPFGDYFSCLESEDPAVVAAPEAVAHFAQQLTGLTTLNHGAISQPRDGQGRLPGRAVTAVLDDCLGVRIRSYLATNRISEHGFFFAAYCSLLGMLTAQREVVTGLPVATRDSLQDIGYHVNTLPLRVDLAAEKSFPELCRELQAATYDTLRYRKFDYFHRDVAPLPGYLNNIFTFQKTPITLPIEGCSLVPVPIDAGSALFDFTLVVESLEGHGAPRGQDADRGYRCKFQASAWFDEIDLAELFTTLVEQVVDRTDVRLGELVLARDESLQSLYARINSYQPLDDPRPIPDLFARAVALWPDNVALQHSGTKLTYRELDEQSDRVAAFLAAACPDTSRVAIWLPRGIMPITCILGILKAGKTYVPIDADSPASRLRLILDDLDESVIICDAPRAATLQARTTILSAEDLQAAMACETLAFRPTPVDVDAGAYQMYTSGSTGVPKGVVVSHRNFASFAAQVQAEYGFTAADVWTQCCSPAFDVSTWEIFGCLFSGGRLLLLSADEARSPQAIYRIVRDERATVLIQTPTAFNGFLREDQAREEELALRSVFVAGEPLVAGQLAPWAERHPLDRTQFFNCYGITETTVISTGHRVSDADIRRCGPSNIGRPWAHCAVYVVDEDLHPLPAGVPGELVLHGESVSPGYYHREELTAQRFVDTELLGVKGVFYRSGDLVRLTQDGDIEFLGRMDQQVQLHGFRVELGEVEAAIGPLITPAECHVRVVERSEGVQQLAAFIAGTQTREELKQLRDDLKGVLPAYMVPDYLVPVTAFPLTVNGKIDGPRLLHFLPTERDERAVAAETATEATIRGFIASAIRHDDFSRDDNFFDIGLSSVHVAEIYQAVTRRFPGIRLDMVDLFRYTTLASLAGYIDAACGAPSGGIPGAAPDAVPDGGTAGERGQDSGIQDAESACSDDRLGPGHGQARRRAHNEFLRRRS